MQRKHMILSRELDSVGWTGMQCHREPAVDLPDVIRESGLRRPDFVVHLPRSYWTDKIFGLPLVGCQATGDYCSSHFDEHHATLCTV